MPNLLNPYRKTSFSFRIGRLFDIDIRIHWIFVAFVALLCLDEVQSTGSLEYGVFLLFKLLLLFGFVLLHELGHSIMAQRSGVRVIDIVLWPLGGIARLQGMIRSPRDELRIAAAGPAVNLAIAAAVFPFWYFWGGGLLDSFLAYILGVNLMLGVFNLVPAFPMDGGRILRALAARKLSYLEATALAVRVGRVLALATLALSVLWWGNYWLAMIALFVLWAGSAELRAARAAEWTRAARSLDPFGKGNEPLEAEVVSAKDSQEGNTAASPKFGSSENLQDYERQFIDLVNRYRKNPKDR